MFKPYQLLFAPCLVQLLGNVRSFPSSGSQYHSQGGNSSLNNSQAHAGGAENQNTVGTAICEAEATHWGASWPGGNCAFTQWPQPKGLGAIAMPSNRWADSQACGVCIAVTGSGGTHVGIVSDQCPSCKPDSLDLDTSIWNLVSGNKPPGIEPISWEIVPCNLGGPMEFINKIGVSPNWTSIQVAGANTPVKSLEASTDGGKTWTNLARQANSNYFQPNGNAGLGAAADLRVTCSDGKTITSQGVDIGTANITNPAPESC